MAFPQVLDFSLTSWLAIAGTAALLWLSIRRPNGLPPGPWIIFPLLGHLPLLRKDPREAMLRIGRKYGDIYHLYMGNCLVIVLNGYDVMREALVKNGDVFSHRPRLPLYEIFGDNAGIAMGSGESWKELRKFAVEGLRELGLGKNKLQDKIMVEVESYVEAIQRKNGQAFDIQKITQVAVCNIICNMAFGQRFDYADPLIIKCIHAIDGFAKGLEATGILNFFPFLKYLPIDLVNKKAITESREVIEEMLIKPWISEHAKRLDNSISEDLIDMYLLEMRKRKVEGTKTNIDEKHLVKIILELFAAGTDTTASVVRWCLVYMMNYPHVQETLHAEIRKKIGQKPPRIEDKADLPYVEAFINEVLRHCSLTPLGVAHATSQDVIFRGYRIPKGTVVIPFIHAAMRDPTVWKYPNVFNPERFLQDSKLVKPEQLIPFSLGRRVCPGESMAKMEIFLFLVTMVQRFQFITPNQTPPSESDVEQGIIYVPRPFLLQAIPRR